MRSGPSWRTGRVTVTVEERWRARLSISGSYNVVAVLDGQLAGMASGVPTVEGGVGELISMWQSGGKEPGRWRLTGAGGAAVGPKCAGRDVTARRSAG